MDRRSYDKDMVSKMYDIIELIYVLNRLTNEFYEEDYSKQYLTDILDDMQNVKYSCDKYRGREIEKNPKKPCYCGHSKRDSFLDKIIFYLKSLNED